MSVRETEKKQRNEEKKIHSFISAYVLGRKKEGWEGKRGREWEGGKREGWKEIRWVGVLVAFLLP